MPQGRSDLAASVRQRLLGIIRKTGTDASFIWSRFATERLLYRLASSRHKKTFVLKGAMLFMVWTKQPYRPTFDLDLLGFGEPSKERLGGIFRSLANQKVPPDGLTFDALSVHVEPIREGQEYPGQRVTLEARLGKARIPLQVDIGFGDAVVPKPEEIRYPTLLDFPAPRLRAYRRETVVAEKLHALTTLGIATSRMKDFFDLFVLSRDFAFDGTVLTPAIAATFTRRKSSLPTETPLALTDEFSNDRMKRSQWSAFAKRGHLEGSIPSLQEILVQLRGFLLPPLKAATGRTSLPDHWKAGGPWQT